MLRIFENPKLKVEMKTLQSDEELYFKAKEIAMALGYVNTKQAIRDHVRPEYKKHVSDLAAPLRSQCLEHPRSLYITEPGLYQLIFGSHLPAAIEFQDWVFKDVLPQIRKTGKYDFKAHNRLMFKIENEFDLHKKVVDYLRRFHPELLFTAGLGELQDTSQKRISSWQKGYQKGQPDLIIQNCHNQFNGFCLEFKTPKGNGVLSEAQEQLLKRYKENNFKTLVSEDYDVIIRAIEDYCGGVRMPCRYCLRRFKTKETLQTHLTGFHKIEI